MATVRSKWTGEMLWPVVLGVTFLHAYRGIWMFSSLFLNSQILRIWWKIFCLETNPKNVYTQSSAHNFREFIDLKNLSYVSKAQINKVVERVQSNLGLRLEETLTITLEISFWQTKHQRSPLSYQQLCPSLLLLGHGLLAAVEPISCFQVR